MSEVWFDGYVHTCRRFGSGYEIVHGTVLSGTEWGSGHSMELGTEYVHGIWY